MGIPKHGHSSSGINAPTEVEASGYERQDLPLESWIQNSGTLEGDNARHKPRMDAAAASTGLHHNCLLSNLCTCTATPTPLPSHTHMCVCTSTHTRTRPRPLPLTCWCTQTPPASDSSPILAAYSPNPNQTHVHVHVTSLPIDYRVKVNLHIHLKVRSPTSGLTIPPNQSTNQNSILSL
jgi:hypothetical protein